MKTSKADSARRARSAHLFALLLIAATILPGCAAPRILSDEVPGQEWTQQPGRWENASTAVEGESAIGALFGVIFGFLSGDPTHPARQ